MNLNKYPNLEAILTGTIAGEFSNWPAVRPELVELIAKVERMEEVLKQVRRWGKDSRGFDPYQVFKEVDDVLNNREVKVVDCTCVPCVCFTPQTKGTLGGLCLGCGAYMCQAHQLALKSSSRPSPATKSHAVPE